MGRSYLAVIVSCGLMAAPCSDVSAQFIFKPKTLSSEEQAKVDKAPLGSRENPVRCEMPAGEQEYLARLRCPSGKPPKVKRSGSVGAGPYGTVMDSYAVKCKETTQDVFMDLYHVGVVENRPIPGFTIVKDQGR